MTAWLDAAGRFFNPEPNVSVLPLPDGRCCVVVDDALANPEGLVAWTSAQVFALPDGYPYPGLVLPAPAELASRVADLFAQHARQRLGARRTLDVSVRLAMVTVPPAQLEPRQWLCHRDRVAADPGAVLFAASVLYLFRDPALGGTSFYVPRRPAAQVERLVADSQRLGAEEFGTRYGLAPGYMAGSSAYFEHIARVPAAWNRMIFYDGGLFHSGDIEQPARLSSDPTRARLTLNGFFTCRRNAS